MIVARLFRVTQTPLFYSYKTFKINNASMFSTSSIWFYNKNMWKKQWVTTDEWEKVKSGDEEIPWAKHLPQDMNKDKWSKEEAFKGMYDFLHILGNDVTISNKLFCDGPEYARCYKADELRRLLKKRQELGHRMHAEDLHSANKRIKYRMKFDNHVRRKGRG